MNNFNPVVYIWSQTWCKVWTQHKLATDVCRGGYSLWAAVCLHTDVYLQCVTFLLGSFYREMHGNWINWNSAANWLLHHDFSTQHTHTHTPPVYPKQKENWKNWVMCDFKKVSRLDLDLTDSTEVAFPALVWLVFNCLFQGIASEPTLLFKAGTKA